VGTVQARTGEQILISDKPKLMKRIEMNRLAMIASLNISHLDNSRIVDMWIRYDTAIQNSVLNNGKQYTLKLYKECYEFLRNLLLELQTQPIAFCKSDSDGIPKPLWPLRPLLRGDRNSRRLALSIARSYEQIRLEIDYDDLDSITESPTPKQEKAISKLSKTLRKFLQRFTRNRPWYLGKLTDPVAPWSKVLTTLSKGPNGPAVATSHLDAKAIMQNEELYSSLQKFNSVLGQSWVTEWMEKQSTFVDDEETYHTGRLGFSSEPAGKTRVFAIGDYWTQLSLKPLQISLQRTLGSISTDASQDQDKGFKTLLEDSKNHPTFCFDLSSASDRIPAKLQRHRLQLMKDKDLADSWYQIMTQRDFYVKATDRKVRWAVGQPLGLLSSFPSFALWHHDIIQLAANWEQFHNGKPLQFFTQYRLLGDDVVIFNAKVARRYQWLLSKIGLTINLSKSIIGDEVNSQIEFAKRLALRGKEMSSIKHNILTKNDKFNLLDLVELLCKRDFISPDTVHYELSSILKSEDLLLLRYLIWLRFSDTPELTIYRKDGNVSLRITREEIIQSITSKRTASIIEKMTQIRALDMETELPRLCSNFEKAVVPYSEKVLIDGSIGDLTGSHPIVLALTQTSRELQFMMFTVLDDLEPDTASPVEYLPVVSTRSYFSDRKTVNRYFSEILLESLKEARHKDKTT
jgi:hypothetical protein